MDQKVIDKKAVRLHHVSSHFTNGLFPTSLLFLLLYVVSGNRNFEITSYYLLIIATIANPFTYFSGILDWILRFKKARTPIFNKKV
ncbi:MAG: hypothetical protein HQK84_09530, partial [Nitrospinae bacterium]|nr:hypothetical protein [Nitrospinota bacterium]